MSDKPTFEVGQEVIYYGRNKRDTPHTVTIEKIGRKWVYFDLDKRFNKDTLEVDGGDYSSPANIFLSQTDVDEFHGRLELFSKFQRLVIGVYGLPTKATLGSLEIVTSEMETWS